MSNSVCPQTFYSCLNCSTCKQTHSPDVLHTVCARCGKALFAEYDLDDARKRITRDSFSAVDGTMWRYREMLPVFDDLAIVSLGEGWTPVLHLKKLGDEMGLPNLYLKEEGINPTGSFKARGLSVAVSKAKELGVKEVMIPSAGNAGGALAAYAAKAGMKAHIFVPRDTPKVNINEIPFYGSEIYLVDGVISDAAKKMKEMSQGKNWFDMSTLKEPYRLEGKKTMGYEIAEQFNWRLPDVIIYPTGGGTGLIGMWKAFDELEKLGWISGKKPRMVSVQASDCAPIVKAFQNGKREAEFWKDSRTIASGLRVPKPFADTIILDVLYASYGTAMAISDDELLNEMKHVAKIEGIFLCPEGATTIAAVRRLIRSGWIKSSETVVVFNTGSGYKYIELYT
ncbi:MAG TPA: threonine synthase [Bacteroidota bacterium]|nr:threonine synthase [Bacteroidota bacterium]